MRASAVGSGDLWSGTTVVQAPLTREVEQTKDSVMLFLVAAWAGPWQWTHRDCKHLLAFLEQSILSWDPRKSLSSSSPSAWLITSISIILFPWSREITHRQLPLSFCTLRYSPQLVHDLVEEVQSALCGSQNGTKRVWLPLLFTIYLEIRTVSGPPFVKTDV